MSAGTHESTGPADIKGKTIISSCIAVTTVVFKRELYFRIPSSSWKALSISAIISILERVKTSPLY